MNTTDHQPDHTADAILARLNALPRRKGKGRDLTPADLVPLSEAKRRTGKPALADWDADSKFIEAKTLGALYSWLTLEGRRALIEGEVVGGWFQDDDASIEEETADGWPICTNADEIACDRDGEFCSTLGIDTNGTSAAELLDLASDHAHADLFFLYAANA